MSSKEAKPKGKAAPKSVEAAQGRPIGTAPLAMVMARHEGAMISRSGKGFSLGELRAAGEQPGLARSWGVAVDPRRRSVLQGNVELVKAWTAHRVAPKKKETEATRIKKEVEKVAVEVEKEAAEVKKEAVRAGKKLEKGAKKAVKEVEAVAEKPKSRAKKKQQKKED